MANREVPMMAEKRINGFDKWEVEGAARTLIEAKEIEGRPKFFVAVKKELVRQVKAAQAAALEAKVDQGLRKTFGKK